MVDRFHILIVDNDENDLFLWRMIVEGFGHQVSTARSGHETFRFLEKQIPDLILLDLKMPGMSGIEVSKQLRELPAYQNIPIIMLTSSDDLGDKLQSFEQGVDDYVTKEMEPLEISKRIEAVLKRYHKTLDTNPLTHLPGNNAIQKELQRRIDADMKLAVVYCDLDHFKAFNDAYGFVEGDRVIQFTADLLRKILKEKGNQEDFLGHVGGDDFVFLTTPDKVDLLCGAIVQTFPQGVKQFYSEDDLKQGYITAKNRRGEMETFPLISISLAVVTNEHRSLSSVAEISRVASEIKKLAKSKSGSNYVVDQRKN